MRSTLNTWRAVVSLSARRAWIEITNGCRAAVFVPVALRKESVDRNEKMGNGPANAGRSLSARRAWIEICTLISYHKAHYSRSPQGERG